ncbi:hypothetical protein RFI_09548 [Reticulomyxa filosa]|uniref:Enoyl-CoA hydratase/isomerase family protein n=1 Tax=Reticulomyxa filosa TaxID=46433 RepID=X6NPG2_RETFI|nr:hypothetical protein RFI_09548 [Reticulomyxa filosa]|eukprot:ETO27584.1 hypothetical protein RFI_09548 [Reticulomyxa filosa]
MGWKIELIENSSIILVKMNSNPGNFLNLHSLQDFGAMMDEVCDPKNEHKYGKYKPIILVSDSKQKIFSAGMDLQSVSASDEKSTSALFTLFSNTMCRWLAIPRKTIAIIDGHAIAGGFFIGLGSDVRVGLNNDQIKIGVNEIHCVLGYVSFKHKLSPTSNWKLLLQGQFHTPKEMFEKFQYLDYLCNTREECMKRAIEEALSVKVNCMEAYLSVKNYLSREILDHANQIESDVMKEFSRVRCCEMSKQRLQEIGAEMNSNKKSEKKLSKSKL